MSGRTRKFKFQHAPGVTIATANGAWVYETGAERLLCDFYYDCPVPTESVTYQLSENDDIGDEVSREDCDYNIREIVARVELSPQAAYRLGQYLVKLADGMGAGPHTGPNIAKL